MTIAFSKTHRRSLFKGGPEDEIVPPLQDCRRRLFSSEGTSLLGEMFSVQRNWKVLWTTRVMVSQAGDLSATSANPVVRPGRGIRRTTAGRATV